MVAVFVADGFDVSGSAFRRGYLLLSKSIPTGVGSCSLVLRRDVEVDVSNVLVENFNPEAES